MGVTIINSGLRQEKGITYSEITDSSADWINVTDGAYFYDIATDLPYYKSSSGLILSLFSEANTLYTSNGTLTGDRTIDQGSHTLTFEGNNTSFVSSNSDISSNILEVQNSSNNKILEVREGSNITINSHGSAGSSTLSIYDNSNARIFNFSENGRVNFSNLPTNAAGLSSGDLWDDGGIVRIGNTVLPDDDSLYTTDSTIGSNRVATLTDNLTFQGGNIFTTINSSSTDESDIESYPLTLRNTELRANNLVGMLFQDNSTDDQARIYTKFGTKNSINFDVKDGTFQNLLKLEGGNVNMSNLPTTSTGLGAGDLWSDNGDVRIGTSTPTPVSSIYTADGALTGDRVVDLENSGQDNSLEFKTTDGVYSSFGFTKISSNGDLSIMSHGSAASALTVYSSDNPTNTVIAPLKIAKFYSGTSHLCSRFINIGYNLTTNYLNIQDSTLKFKGFGVDVHTIEHVNVNSYVSFFVNGIGNGGFIVGNNTKIGTEKISLQSSTAIKGTGTAGSSALTIYDNDTTPNELWDFLDNGDLTGSKSRVKLIAQNATTNTDSNYILRLRKSNDATDFFFVGNGGEVRLGNANNTGTGDKSTHIMWGADVVTMAGSGNYAILMGHSVNANYSGNDVIGMGRTITLNNQRQIALGQGITFTGEGTFGMGRTLTSTAGDNNIIGTAISSTGRYSNLIGKYLQSSATGASVIGNGNTSTGAKLVNNTANSLALGWETTTPKHLLSSTGSQLGGKTELTSTDDGFLMNRLTTAQRDAISTPDTHLLIFNVDNDRIERYDGTAWVGEIAGYGVLGIANTLGTYTYYSNYTDAMSAAVAGDTVEQFGNITVTSNVTITIKDGVSINMNGYTYTTDGSTVNAFNHDDTLYEETRFQNGTVKHINTGGVGNALTIGGESHMDCTGLIVISDGAYCLNFNTDGAQRGRLIGGSYIHTGGSGWNHIIEGNVYGAYFNTGDGAVRITGGSLDNCRIDGSVFIASGIISNSRVIGGSYSHAINNEGTVFNTYASSALFMGINNTNGIVENSKGISNATYGIYSTAGTINNSIGESTASYGIYLSNVNAYANGCIAESSAAAAIRLNLGKAYNCRAVCNFNDPSGDGILITQNDGFEVIDSFSTVVNSSAFAIDGTQSGIISGLKGQGMTTLIGTTTNTAGVIDTFGNGLL